MSLKITGKDFKKIHELIEKVKEEIDTNIFAEYVNSISTNGVIVDPLSGEYVFFDNLVYMTNLDSTIGRYDLNQFASSWSKISKRSSYMLQIQKILKDVEKNQNKLKYDKKAWTKFIIDWYKQLIDSLSNFKSSIKLPYTEDQYYGELVSKYCGKLPWFEDEFDRTAQKFIQKYLSNPNDPELIINALAIQAKNKLRSYMFEPNAKDMIDILIISSYWTEANQVKRQIDAVADNMIRNQEKGQTREILIKKLYDVQKQNEYKIWKIWFLIKNQAPKDKAILKILQYVKECKAGNKNDNIAKAYPKHQHEMTDGLRNLVGIIMDEKQFIKQWINELKDSDSDNDKKIISLLKKSK